MTKHHFWYHLVTNSFSKMAIPTKKGKIDPKFKSAMVLINRMMQEKLASDRKDRDKTKRKAREVKKKTNSGGYEPQGFLDSLQQFCTLPDAISGLTNTANDVGNSQNVRDLVNSFKDISANLSRLSSDGLKATVDVDISSLTRLFDTIWENRKTVALWLLTGVIISLYVAGASRSVISTLVGIATVVAVVYGKEHVRPLWTQFLDVFNGYFAPGGQIVAQSGDDVSTLMRLGALLGFKSCVGEVKDSFVSNFFDEFWEKFKAFPSQSRKMDEIFTFYSKFFQDLLNSFSETVGCSKRFSFAMDLYPESTKLISEVELFIRDTLECQHVMVSETAAMCQSYLCKLSTHIQDMTSDLKWSGMRVIVVQLQSRLRTLAADLELRGAGKTVSRVPPEAHIFHGESGIGKSFMLTTLTIAGLYTIFRNSPQALRQLDAKQYRDFYFPIAATSKHWEGYRNQPIVHMDEMGSQRDVAGIDPAVSSIDKCMRMMNDAVFPLEMANLEMKGRVEFDSALFLGTTNVKAFTDFKSITNPEAFCRRFQGWDVKVHTQYGYEYTDGENSWTRPKPVDQLRIQLEEEGKSEEEIQDFFMHSGFLYFRRRSTIARPGEYVDSKIYTLVDVIDCICDLLEKREAAKVVKRDHINGLTSFYKARLMKRQTTPGAWQPQSAECECMACHGEAWAFWDDQEFLDRNFPDLDICRDDVNASWWRTYCRAGWESIESDNPLWSDCSYVCYRQLYVDKMREKASLQELFFTAGANLRIKHFVQNRSILAKLRSGFVRHVAPLIVEFTVAFVAITGVSKLCRWIFGNDENYEAQALCDLNAQEVIGSTLRRNTWHISDDTRKRCGYGIFIHDRIFLVPQHFRWRWKKQFEDSSADRYVHLNRVGDGVDSPQRSIPITELISNDNCFFPYGEDADLVAIYIRLKTIPRMPTLRNSFARENAILRKGFCALPRVNRETSDYAIVSCPYVPAQDRTYTIGDDNLVHNEKCITYSFKTVNGDCGLPIAIQDVHSTQKLAGIHVAGVPSIGKGLAIIFSKEKCDATIAHFEKSFFLVESQMSTEPKVIMDDTVGWNDLFVDESQPRVGKTNLCWLKPTPGPVTTAIRPSSLFKRIKGEGVDTKPARLRSFRSKDGLIIDPIMLAESKYHLEVKPIDTMTLDLSVVQCLRSMFIDSPNDCHELLPPRVLTDEEMVVGIVGVDGCDPIPRGTSAGYPHCTFLPDKGKRALYGSEGDYTLDSPAALEVLAEVHRTIDLAKKGVRRKFVSKIFPKDERLNSAKVDGGKVRLIMAINIVLALCIRRSYGSLTAWLVRNRIGNGFAIGVNVYQEADMIVSYLGTESRIIAGDFSNFDGHLPYDIMTAYNELATAYFDDEGSDEWRVREVLMEDLANSRHLTRDGHVVEWVGSNPSGNPLTTVMNTFSNLILIRLAALKILGLEGPNSWSFLKEFDKHLRVLCYGDDNLIAVMPGSRYWNVFNQATFTEAFASMGFKYTDETKGLQSVASDRRLVGQVAFLKRTILETNIISGKRYCMALSYETIKEMVQWRKRHDIHEEDVKRNVQNALEELSLHSRAFFEEKAAPILEACKEVWGYVPYPHTYDLCQVAAHSRASAW
jgi:hypothetical protein